MVFPVKVTETKYSSSTTGQAKLENLHSILQGYATGKYVNVSPLKTFFGQLSKNGGYATLAELFAKLSPAEKEAFISLIKEYHVQIFGNGIPTEVQDIIEPKKAKIEHPKAKTPVLSVVLPEAEPAPKPDTDALVKEAVNKSAFLQLFPEKMYKNGVVKYYSNQETIINQNSRSKDVYVILKGKVKVEIFDSKGKVINTLELESGVVGERSIMQNTPTNAKVTVMPGTQLLSIPGVEFKTYLKGIPKGSALKGLLTGNFGFSAGLAAQIMGQDGVKVELCRPGEVPIVKDASAKYLYLVLDGELGVFDTFGEIRDAKGEAVKIKTGDPVGEIALLNGGKRTASVVNNGNADVLLLKIPMKAFKALYKNAEFKTYAKKAYKERIAASLKSADLSTLKKIGFEYKFDAKLDPKIQAEILKAAQSTYESIIKINPEAAKADKMMPLLKFICRALETQHLDNPLKYVSHGADHSVNTMLQTKALIDGSPEVQAALKSAFGSVKKGRILAQLVALFHDVGYPEVTKLLNQGKDVPKWKHQKFSADLVKMALPYKALCGLIPGLTEADYGKFITAIEHHGSDSPLPKDFKAGRPYRFASLGDNPLLVLMRLSDNLDMLKTRLNLVQKDPLFLKTLEKMTAEAVKIEKMKGLGEAEKAAKIKESNAKILLEAEKAIDAEMAKAGEKGKFKYELMKDILKGCNHESYLHFISVDLAQNISVTIEKGKVSISLVYNTPLQFVPKSVAGFQVKRLGISLSSMLLDGETEISVKGLGKVNIKDGEIYINNVKVSNPDHATVQKIVDAVNAASEKMKVKAFAPPPSTKKLATALGKLPETPELMALKLVSKFAVDPYGAFGPDAMADVTLKLLKNGQKAVWFSINVSKLKYFNDTHGHEAGNEYLKALAKKLSDATDGFAFEVQGKPMIVRQGPNFFILLSEGANVEKAKAAFDKAVNGAEFEFSFEDSNGKKMDWKMSLSPHVNENVLIFDPAKGEFSKMDIHNAANMDIHYLNQKKGVGEHIAVDPKAMKKYELFERIVNFAAKYSGLKPLPYFEAFEKAIMEDIIKIQNGKKAGGAIAYFDGNRTGGYRKFGFAGEKMIDALFQYRFPEIVKDVFTSKGYDVTVVRYGPGSEEFFVYGKNMDSATMEKCMLEFMKKLSEPFQVRMEVAELQKTELGKKLLSGELTGSKPKKYLHTYADGSKAWVVDVDINVPRGVKGEYKGASITAAVMELTAGDPAKIKKIMAENPKLSEAQAIFKWNKEKVEKAGEAAKEANALRGSALVRINAKGESEIYMPAQDKFVSADYLKGEYRDKLMKLADGNPTMQLMLKEMSAVELAQVKAGDVESGDVKKVAGPKLYFIEGKAANNAELVKAVGNAPKGSVVVYESGGNIAVRGEVKHFKAWIEKGDMKAFDKIVDATVKANKGVPKEFIAGFLYGKKAQLALEAESSWKSVKVSLPVQKIVAGREALLEKLTTFIFETEGPDGKKISVQVKIKDAQDLLSGQDDVIKAAQERVMEEIKKSAPDAKSAEVLKALETHLAVMKTSYQLKEYMNAKLSRVYAETYLKELNAALSEIKDADANKTAELLARIEKGAAEAVDAYRVGFEAKANEYIKESGKKSLTDADLKNIWKNLEGEKLIKEGKYAEFHGATMTGLGKVVVRTAHDGLLGLGVGAVLELIPELTSSAKFDLARYLKNVGQSGLHWAQFGLMCGAGEHLLGWSPVKAMGAAMVLPALWDLSKPKVPYAVKGQVLVSHAAGLGGFVFGMKAAGWTKAAKIPKVGGLAGLALGMLGAWGLGKLNAYAYGKSESWQDVVDSKFTKTTGAVLGDTEKLVTYWCGVGLASSALAGAAAGLASLDALGVSLGVEATLGGYSAGLSSTAGILSTAAGALIVLAAVKGGFSLHYHLANGDYEKSIAQRFGKYLMDYYKYKDSGSILKMMGWAVTELGADFKYDQFVEHGAKYFAKLPGKMVEYRGGLYTEYQKKYLEGIIDYIGKDFKDSLSLGKNMALDYVQSAFKHLVKDNGLTGNTDADYDTALAHVKLLAAGLSKEIILSEKEQGIYKKVMEYLQGHEVSGFEDPKLVSYVAGLSSVGNETNAKAVLKKIELAMTQDQIKYLLLVDPKNMGKDLHGMLSFHLEMYAKKGEAEAKYKEQMAEFEKKHPEIAKKVKNGEELNAGEGWIYTNATMKMVNPGLFNTPFAGTPIMKMGKVQKLHDQIAYFFDEKGRLKPGKAEAFAKWVLSKKIDGKDFKEKLLETEKKYKEIRANQLLVAALKGEAVKTTAQDVKLGLVDEAGNFKLDNPYVKAGLDKVRAKIVKNIAKEKSKAKTDFKKANAQAKKWQMKYIYWKKKQLTLLSKDAADPAALAKVEKNLAYIGKKLPAKMKKAAIAAAKLKSFKLALTAIQKKWKAETNPLKKAILAAQIEGLGGSIKNG